jgi:predicted RecA/RadA family phage recombinase
MKNLVKSGQLRSFASTSAKESGEPAQIGAQAGIATGKFDANEEGEYLLAGVVRLKKATALAAAAGAKVDWDAVAKEVVATTTGTFPLGNLDQAAASGAGDVDVMVNGLPYSFN